MYWTHTNIDGFVYDNIKNRVKGLTGETIVVVAVTQLTFNLYVLNFGEA